jgi:heme A synthase
VIGFWSAVITVNLLLAVGVLALTAVVLLCALPWLPRALRERRADRARTPRRESK